MVYVPPKDRVLELSTSDSQDTFALDGVPDASYNLFSEHMSIGDTTLGAVVEANTAFKTGTLTYSAADEITIGDDGESLGTFSNTGFKEIFMGLPAPKLFEGRLKGADIASAATVDLDAATGDLLDINGTTTITAVTLAPGRERTIRFTGILTLTNGGSLVLPGGQNIVTAAGDFAIVRGYASGVVRMVLYQRASSHALEVTIASAGTTDLGAVAAEHVAISGNTTITSFGSGANKRKFIRFTGTPIITYNNTTLILPGSANIQAAAGDTCYAISTAAGNWRVYDYTPAASAPLGTTGIAVHKGRLDLSATTAGQIKFPATQNASADANTFDDYEEGTWTPILTGFTVDVTSQVQGRYTKFGRMVLWWYEIYADTSIASVRQTSQITGFPFVPAHASSGTTEGSNAGTNGSGVGRLNAVPTFFPPSWDAISGEHYTGNGFFTV